jgi:acetyl-CoA acetyltransferase
LEVYVLGVGMTPFTRHEQDGVALGVRAVGAALEDAGMETRDVEALYAGHVHGGMVAGERVGAGAGLAGIPTVNLENACATGTTAIIEASYAIAAGRYDCVVACGFEKVSDRPGMISPADGDYEGELGLVFPAWHAMSGRLYMHTHGLTRDQLSLVAVKNRRNGAKNPLSHFKQEVTTEEVAASREVASPLRLYDCCPKSDGGAAVVLGSRKFLDETRRRHGRAVAVRGTGLVSGKPDGAYEPLFEDVTARAARAAYDEAGIEPEDVEFAEVHDCFTIAEGLRVEGLGLCEPGTYFRQLEEGRWFPEGRTPINASGGLLAKGHPLGATGVGQLCEIATQMRGAAGERQLESVDVAVAHTRGGSVPGTEGGSCGVLVCVGD